MQSTNTAHSHLRVCTNSPGELVVLFIELVLACLCVCVCVWACGCVCVYVCVGVCVLVCIFPQTSILSVNGAIFRVLLLSLRQAVKHHSLTSHISRQSHKQCGCVCACRMDSASWFAYSYRFQFFQLMMLFSESCSYHSDRRSSITHSSVT